MSRITKKLIFISIIWWAVAAIGQTTLKPSVFINTKSGAFKRDIIEIKEYTNYEVYEQLQRLMRKGDVGAINNGIIRQTYITHKVSLAKGNYIIDDSEQRSEFEVGNGGVLIGKGGFLNKKRNIAPTYIFDSGKLSEIHLFNSEGRLRKKNIFKGNVVEGLVYDHAGNITQKIEIYTNLKEGADQIVTTYHKNGNPSEEIDSIRNITKECYQNGKLEIEIVDSKATTKYYPKGKLTGKWYITERDNCRELYDRGIITQKTYEGRSIRETIVLYYKDGGLVETKKL